MSKITTEEIAEIRDAVRKILLETQHIRLPITRQYIIKQVKRIDRLLPQVKFEGGK